MLFWKKLKKIKLFTWHQHQYLTSTYTSYSTILSKNLSNFLIIILKIYIATAHCPARRNEGEREDIEKPIVKIYAISSVWIFIFSRGNFKGHFKKFYANLRKKFNFRTKKLYFQYFWEKFCNYLQTLENRLLE